MGKVTNKGCLRQAEVDFMCGAAFVPYERITLLARFGPEVASTYGKLEPRIAPCEPRFIVVRMIFLLGCIHRKQEMAALIQLLQRLLILGTLAGLGSASYRTPKRLDLNTECSPHLVWSLPAFYNLMFQITGHPSWDTD